MSAVVGRGLIRPLGAVGRPVQAALLPAAAFLPRRLSEAAVAPASRVAGLHIVPAAGRPVVAVIHAERALPAQPVPRLPEAVSPLPRPCEAR